MNHMPAIRSVLALAIILFVTLWAVPAYPWHGSGNITALAIDPVTPTTLYAGTSDRGVFKTTDAGASWSATGLTNVYVASLAIDPLTPTTLYALTDTGGVYTPTTSGGVFKSTDGGASWSPLPRPAGGGGCYDWYPCGGVLALAIDPHMPTTLYAGTDAITSLEEDGTLWYTSGDVFKSTDGGATWGALGLASHTWWLDRWVEGHSVSALAIDPLTPTTLYAGTKVGPNAAYSFDVFKSMDGGASWSATGLTREVLFLAIDPLTPTTVFARARYMENYESRQGVFKSTDGGASWRLLTGLAAGGGSCYYLEGFSQPCDGVLALAIDPLTPTTLYAGTGTGVYKSTDGGASWSATDLTGVRLSSRVSSLAIDPLTPTTLYAGTGDDVYKSTNSGVNWNFTATTLSSVSLDPTSVTAGTTSTGTVTLSAAAPAGGAVVALSSSNTAVATVPDPASVTVPAGATSATFTVSTFACTPGSVTISGTYGGVTRSAGLTVTTTPDTVAIQLADYFASMQVLRVAAKSTSSTATLQVFVTSTGDLIGTLRNLGYGNYSGRFKWPVNPQNITVRSSLCGSATSVVTSK